MAINFNSNSVWNLKPISVDSIRGEVNGLLVNGEDPVMAFQTIRDQLIFTNKRIIAIDVQASPASASPTPPCPIPRFNSSPYKPPVFWSSSPIRNCF